MMFLSSVEPLHEAKADRGVKHRFDQIEDSRFH